MELKIVQQQFSDTLRYKESLITTQIKESASFKQDDLLQIYRNNFVMGVTEALSATYQHCLALVGEDFFNIAARNFILEQPPHENNIINYGDGFATFLSHLPQLQTLPYIAEMARFEWLLEQTSNKQIEPQSFDFEKLVKLPETQLGDIILQVPTQVTLFSSEQDIYQLYNMIIKDQVKHSDLNSNCYLALKKEIDFTVALIPLQKAQFLLLQQITQQRTLAEIPSEFHALLPSLIEQKLLNGFTIRKSL
ncbi:DNA-binding domain-containing protein [Psychromonas sp. MME2]|uniref:HvfC/BufC N-terminal domain-containing protein n=1 Tax=unclassified Psychromonas TaxID=2614957 RepID=UPI00339BB8CB